MFDRPTSATIRLNHKFLIVPFPKSGSPLFLSNGYIDLSISAEYFDVHVAHFSRKLLEKCFFFFFIRNICNGKTEPNKLCRCDERKTNKKQNGSWWVFYYGLVEESYETILAKNFNQSHRRGKRRYPLVLLGFSPGVKKKQFHFIK